MDVWSFFADTDRLNQIVGLPSVRFIPLSNGQKGHYRAVLRVLGIPVHYEELPFDWVEGRYYKVLRRFERGPLESVGGGLRIAPVENGTELEIFAQIVPRGALGTWLAPRLGRAIAMNKILLLAKRFEKHYLGLGIKPSSAAVFKPAVNRAQLEFRLAALPKPASAALISTLRDYLTSASDIEVSRLRPLELAQKWNAAPLDVLELCLRAARAGVLDLGWHVLCPRCSGVVNEAASLAAIKNTTHCDTCQISFNADLASSVEARFAPNPAIRQAHPAAYCIGGPALTPQIAVQWRLLPRETRQEEINLRTGSVRIRSYQAPGTIDVETNPQTSEGGTLEIRCAPSGVSADVSRVRSGPIQLRIVNDSDQENLVVLERAGWRDLAATAALVMSLQEFRDLFPADAVAPGQELRLASLAVLFTDLSNSTSLYETIGDSKAFAFVQNHFRYLKDCITAHKGGIVKTIGDAVMASFPSAPDALEAAIEMQKGWAEFMRQYGAQADVQLKVGLHQGPCITINNKGQLDYFGGMINTAARVQAQSAGGDILLTSPVWDDPGVRTMQAAGNLKAEQLTASLKGIRGEKVLYRIVINARS